MKVKTIALDLRWTRRGADGPWGKNRNDCIDHRRTLMDGQITYICFECDRRWRGPKDSEAESCPEDGCPGYGEPLG